MALIQCKECGGSVSDRAKTCPHCGCQVEKLQPQKFCPECGFEVSDNDTKCMNCGCPSSEFVSQNNNLQSSSLSKQKANKVSIINAQALFEKGVEYDDQGLFEEAYKCFKESAKQNYVEAFSHLGYYYLVGQGVPCNYNKAFKYLSKSATTGNIYALYNLGLCYINGFGVGVDHLKGLSLIREAANQGHPDAVVFLSENTISWLPNRIIADKSLVYKGLFQVIIGIVAFIIFIYITLNK